MNWVHGLVKGIFRRNSWPYAKLVCLFLSLTDQMCVANASYTLTARSICIYFILYANGFHIFYIQYNDHTYGHNDMYTYLLYHTHDKILLKMYSCFSSHTQQASIQTHLQADERAFSLNPSSFSLYRHNLSVKCFFYKSETDLCHCCHPLCVVPSCLPCEISHMYACSTGAY